MRGFVFPGQGSQAVGMGVALAGTSVEARAVFDEVDEARDHGQCAGDTTGTNPARRWMPAAA